MDMCFLIKLSRERIIQKIQVYSNSVGKVFIHLDKCQFRNTLILIYIHEIGVIGTTMRQKMAIFSPV